MNALAATPTPSRKWLRRLRFALRVAGIFTVTIFVLAAPPILWRARQIRHISPQPADFASVLNHGELAKTTQIREIVHAQKQGVNQFVELKTDPIAESALEPSQLDTTFEQGWTLYSSLDPSVASLVRETCEYARAKAHLDWFPEASALSDGRIWINFSYGSLKHGEMSRANLLICDPEAGRIFAADIRIP